MKPEAKRDDEAMERIIARAPDLREGLEQIRAAKLAAPDKITAHLRTELRDHFAKVCRGMSAPAKDAVRRWIDQARVENLAEWLDAGDHWQALEGRVESIINPLLDSLHKCYAGRTVFFVIANITAEDETDPDDPQRKALTIRSDNYTVRLAGEHSRPFFEEQTPEQREERRRQDIRLGLTPRTEEDYERERKLAEINASNFRRRADWFDGLRLCFQERHWLDLLDTAEGVDRLRWLGWLARPWLEEYAKEQAALEERKANAKPLQSVPRTLVGEREFVRIDKLGAGISWAFGGHGVPLSSVDLDGKTFAPQADLAVVPAGIALLPADHEKKAHQTVLALDDSGNADAPPLAMAIASATQYAISLPAAKLAILIMAGAISKQQPTTQTSIRELTERLNPGLNSHNLCTKHYQIIFRALDELSRQYIYFPNGFKYQAFFTALTWRDLTPAEYDHEILVGITPIIEAALASYREKNTSYKGQFLLELTGTLALDRGGPLRQYVRAAAAWNAYWKEGGEPDPVKVPTLSTEHWASLTNYLPPAAVEYLRTRNRARGGHVRAAEAVKKILKDAEELEAAGLVVIDKANREQIRLLPPDIYLEAWRKAKVGGKKPASK
jgi:hypothetical protein